LPEEHQSIAARPSGILGGIMKILKILLYVLVIGGALAGFGWFFVSQLGAGRSANSLAGVILTPPPGYAIVEQEEMTPATAATALEGLIRSRTSDKVGIKFRRNGSIVYWLADVPGDQLEELAGPNGTRVQTIWRGEVSTRLAWGHTHGDLAVPGLPPGEQKNLYH
jgi:hypothetical protein